jgi:hypothetical protein
MGGGADEEAVNVDGLPWGAGGTGDVEDVDRTAKCASMGCRAMSMPCIWVRMVMASGGGGAAPAAGGALLGAGCSGAALLGEADASRGTGIMRGGGEPLTRNHYWELGTCENSGGSEGLGLKLIKRKTDERTAERL